jgi:two-component system response regulator FlrC
MTESDSTSPLPVQAIPFPDFAPLVLVADNEGSILELFRATLEIEQFRVLTATNGQEALALAERWMPDVLVTDVKMPALDGFGLLGAVRRLYPSMPVIMMSGDQYYGERPLEDVAVEHGVMATLVKPFDVSLLHEAVRNALPHLEPVSLQVGHGVEGTIGPKRQ